MSRCFIRTVFLMASLTITSTAFAQAKYPLKPIRLVVPSAPGGTTDFSARLIADPLNKAMGQPLVVDNRPGGSGNVGNQLVAQAKADGYTLLVSYSGYHVGNPHLFKRAGWDPIRDFAPVAMLTRAPQVIAARRTLPAENVEQLVAYAKANPGKLNYASSGVGSIQHIAGELLKQLTGISATHVPYKGAGPAVQDLMAGGVDFFITTPASLVSQIQAGRVKGLAVTSTKRLASLPNVPTAAEAGLKGYELDSWFALYAPSGTPVDVIRELNRQVNLVLSMPEIVKRAGDSGTEVQTMTPGQLSEYTKSELDHWGKIIKSAGIVAE